MGAAPRLWPRTVTAAARPSPRLVGPRFAAFYAAKFILLGVQLPFFAGWLALNGFVASEIGLLTGAALMARLLLGPFIAYWADRQSDERRAMRIVAALFAIGGVGLAVAPGKATIAAAAFLVYWTFGLLVPLSDSLALRADRNGWIRYGRIRATGSASFLLTTILGGAALARLGVGAAAPAMAAAGCATFLAALAMPAGVGGRGPGTAPSWREAPRLLKAPIFLAALAAAGLIQGAHAVYYAFSYLRWAELGYSETVIGLLWATGVIAEIVLLVAARNVAGRLSPSRLLMIGAGAAAVRWFATALEPSLAVLFLIQTLHAGTFAAAYLGSIEFIDRAAPARLVNTAMTVMSATGVGAVTGAATIAAGYLWESEGPAAAYFLMSVMGVAAFAISVWLAARWDGRRLFE